MGSNGVHHMSKDLVEEGVSNQEVDMDFGQTGSVDESVVEKESADERSSAGSFQEADDQNNSVRQSALEISQSKELNVSSSPRRALSPSASELLELHTAERAPINVVDLTSESNKSIPRLKIAILVVGTRGDVQPFLSIAKRLQDKDCDICGVEITDTTMAVNQHPFKRSTTSLLGNGVYLKESW